jgi:DNA replication and repair protein RecF
MILRNINLRNFRLHEDTSVEFSNKLNFLVGGNGQGKTSILEAIYYLCTTKNLLSSSDSDTITFGRQFMEIKGVIEDLAVHTVRLNYDSRRKYYYLDDKMIPNSAEIIGKFPIVTLIQSDHQLTQGSPSDRRKFVDSTLSQLSHSYLDIYIDYNKILRQRSNLLSQIRENRNLNLYDQLEAWTESLILKGAQIIEHRIKFVSEFNEYLKNAYQYIMGDVETPFISYSTLCSPEENIAEEFRKQIDSVKEDEIRRGVNLIGPHRDDLLFLINDKELKKYGSQGQHKTFQIALKFAQFFYIKERINRTPVFLMDDVFGELDKYRAEKISAYLSEIGQAFITMTDLTYYEELNNDNRLITVENGKAKTVN